MFGQLLSLGLNFQQAEKFTFLFQLMLDSDPKNEESRAFQLLLKALDDFAKD